MTLVIVVARRAKMMIVTSASVDASWLVTRHVVQTLTQRLCILLGIMLMMGIPVHVANNIMTMVVMMMMTSMTTLMMILLMWIMMIVLAMMMTTLITTLLTMFMIAWTPLMMLLLLVMLLMMLMTMLILMMMLMIMLLSYCHQARTQHSPNYLPGRGNGCCLVGTHFIAKLCCRDACCAQAPNHTLSLRGAVAQHTRCQVHVNIHILAEHFRNLGFCAACAEDRHVHKACEQV